MSSRLETLRRLCADIAVTTDISIDEMMELSHDCESPVRAGFCIMSIKDRKFYNDFRILERVRELLKDPDFIVRSAAVWASAVLPKL
jgi:hypothetical protein